MGSVLAAPGEIVIGAAAAEAPVMLRAVTEATRSLGALVVLEMVLALTEQQEFLSTVAQEEAPRAPTGRLVRSLAVVVVGHRHSDSVALAAQDRR